MALSIYCFQTDQIKRAQRLLLITFFCGLAFLVIKLGFEYMPKWTGYFMAFDPALSHYSANIDSSKAMLGGLLQFVEGYGGKAPGTWFNYAFAESKQVPLWWSVYYSGTAIHALHVIIGMAMIARAYVRSFKGHYGSGHYTYVEITGLYWHLVDLVWIFLFPLLYLIH
jgi:cytochrome c oxidase subunit 3